jgi:hypothetical protein
MWVRVWQVKAKESSIRSFLMRADEVIKAADGSVRTGWNSDDNELTTELAQAHTEVHERYAQAQRA